jgi:formylmethanofuran dehydrogenase subunit A
MNIYDVFEVIFEGTGAPSSDGPIIFNIATLGGKIWGVRNVSKKSGSSRLKQQLRRV